MLPIAPPDSRVGLFFNKAANRCNIVFYMVSKGEGQLISSKTHQLITSAVTGVLALALAVTAFVPSAYALENMDPADFNNLESKSMEGESVDTCEHISNDGTITKEPSCSSAGEKTYSCTKCGKILQVQSVPKLNHIPSEEGKVVRQPTRYDVGQINYYCTACGELVFAKAIPMLPWNEKQPENPISPTPAPTPSPNPNPSIPTVPPTSDIPVHCENHEWVSDEEMLYCRKCNQIGHYHNFSQNLKCDETGHWRECLVVTCGQRKDFGEHEWVEKDGRTECRVCGYVESDNSTPPAPTHPPIQSPMTPMPNKDNENKQQPNSTQAPMHTIHGQITGSTFDLSEEEKEPAASPKSTQPPEDSKPKMQHMGITVPIFFANAEFDENGNCFIGNLNFQTDKSAPVEIQDVELTVEKGWKLVTYEGEDKIGKKQVSVIINHCPSIDDGFEFNPKYFTVPIPQNGLLELPFKVCTQGPDWTSSSEESPLKIVAHIGAAS